MVLFDASVKCGAYALKIFRVEGGEGLLGGGSGREAVRQKVSGIECLEARERLPMVAL